MSIIEISEETKKKIEALTPEKLKKAEDLVSWMADHVSEIAGLANGTHKVVLIADDDLALRKAKADGMREAKTVIREFHDGKLLTSDQLDTELALWELLDLRASKLQTSTDAKG